MTRKLPHEKPIIFRALTLLTSLLFLPACGTLEVGLERTATPVESVVPTAGHGAIEGTSPPRSTATRAPSGENGEAQVATPPATEAPAPPSWSDVPPEFWDSVGVSPYTPVALLAQPDGAASRFGDIATMYVDGTQRVQITSDGYNLGPVLSADGQLVAYRSVPSTITSLEDPTARLREGVYDIWVITVDGAQAWQLTDSEQERGVPIWSPDSRTVAFVEGADGVLVEIDVSTQIRREITAGASAPRYRPDDGGIGCLIDDGDLAWRPADGGAFEVIIPAETLPPNTSIKDFDWLPDGQHVVYTLVGETERVEDLPVGIEYAVWVAHIRNPDPVKLADDARDVSVSPDGLTIAALQGSGYGDACFVDQRLVFLRLAPDLGSARRIDLEGFDGYPSVGQDQSFYPASNVTWVSDRLAIGLFRITCAVDPMAAGRYLIDPMGRRMVQVTGDD